MTTFTDVNLSGGNPYPGDMPLLRQLGLSTGRIGYDWTLLGQVEVQSLAGRENAVVEVYATAMPAQFFKFIVTRPLDGEDGSEVIKIRTGSGEFSQFWPTADLVARHLLDMSQYTRRTS